MKNKGAGGAGWTGSAFPLQRVLAGTEEAAGAGHPGIETGMENVESNLGLQCQPVQCSFVICSPPRTIILSDHKRINRSSEEFFSTKPVYPFSLLSKIELWFLFYSIPSRRLASWK